MIIILCKIQLTILNTNNLPPVIRYHVFLSDINNFQTDLFDPYMGP